MEWAQTHQTKSMLFLPVHHSLTCHFFTLVSVIPNRGHWNKIWQFLMKRSNFFYSEPLSESPAPVLSHTSCPETDHFFQLNAQYCFSVYSLISKREISISFQHLFHVVSYWLARVAMAKRQNKPELCFSDQTRFQFKCSLSSPCRTPQGGLISFPFFPIMFLVKEKKKKKKKKRVSTSDILKVDAKPWGYCTVRTFPGLWNNLPTNLIEMHWVKSYQYVMKHCQSSGNQEFLL